MDIINVQNLVALMKDRCGKIDVSNETEYPTTRGLLMHAAILIEDRILESKAGTVGYFFENVTFPESTNIKIVTKNNNVLARGKYGEYIDFIAESLCDLKIDYVTLGTFMPMPNSDIVEPVLEIRVK